MKMTEKQFEKIARVMDGEHIELTSEESKIVTDILRGEKTLAGLGETDVPKQTLYRARRSLKSAITTSKQRSFARTLRNIAGLAVAASLLIATVLYFNYRGTDAATNSSTNQPIVKKVDKTEKINDNVPADVFIAFSEQTPADDELELLSLELDEFDAEITVSATPANPMDMRMDSLENEINDFWLNDPSDSPI